MVFLGPSLPRGEAQTILDATYRPPVRKGDIYALLTSGVRRVVVIDGIFHSGPSVWHRELLAAIDEGIEVLGAGSMGALRAAELHPFGMIGVGTVFEWFRSGVLDGDDEVALHHASEEFEYRAFSEPLVNIRATLERAVVDRQLSADEVTELIAGLKRTHYPDRSYRRLLEFPLVQAWPPARRDGLAAYLAARAVDVKAADCRRVLAHCKDTPASASVSAEATDASELRDPWRAEFRRVVLGFRKIADGGASIPWSAMLRGLSALGTRWDVARAAAITSWCLADLARRRGLDCPQSVRRAFADRWASEHAAGDLTGWARSRGMTRRECDEIIAQRARVAWMRELGPEAFTVTWDREAACALATLLAQRSPGQALRADDGAFLAGWLELHGLACPRTTRDQLLTGWRLRTAKQRSAAARRWRLSLARLRSALAQRVAASWLLSAGPESLGFGADIDVIAAQDLQLSTPLDELIAIGLPR